MSEARDVALPAVDQDIKADQRALIRAYGGQVPTAALLGRTQSRYSDAGSNSTRVFLTTREVAELEDRTAGTPGYPIVTRGLARRQGFELVVRPRALPAPEHMIGCAGQLLKEGGDVIERIGKALSNDGKIEADEAAAISREADELIQVAVTLKAAADAIAAGDQ